MNSAGFRSRGVSPGLLILGLMLGLSVLQKSLLEAAGDRLVQRSVAARLRPLKPYNIQRKGGASEDSPAPGYGPEHS